MPPKLFTLARKISSDGINTAGLFFPATPRRQGYWGIRLRIVGVTDSATRRLGAWFA